MTWKQKLMPVLACLFTLFGLPLILGQGCVGSAPMTQETNSERAYRVCTQGALRLSPDNVHTVYEAGLTDYANGINISDERYDIYQHCDASCTYDYICTACYDCFYAVIDWSYEGNARSQRAIPPDLLPAVSDKSALSVALDNLGACPAQ